jgi:hypothetical protein
MRAAALIAWLSACGASSLDGDHLYTRIACDEGTADCDGRLSTGCETDVTLPSACGGCGVVCAPGAHCVHGACAP